MRIARVALMLATVLVASSAFGADKPKVVILGFDGADAHLVEKWMNEGKLPNLAKLRDEGSFSPLQPTNPPQTPVSWSAFATGTNPGKTEIFDFLKRKPDDYLPDFAMNSEGKKPFLFGSRNGVAVGAIAGGAVALLLLLVTLPFRMGWGLRVGVALLLGAGAGLPAGFVATHYIPTEVPEAINHRKGQTMWELASQAGKRVQVLRVPATFPAETVEGNMISGLGVPDMRGRVGTPSFYTSDPTFQPGANNNEFSLELIRLPARRGKIQTRLIGPANKPFYDYVVDRKTADIADPKERNDARRRVRQELDDAEISRRIDLPLTLDADDQGVTVSVSGQSHRIQPGEWSPWFVLDFPMNWLVDRVSPLKGMARFKLLKVEPEIELYLSPVSFHPDCHPIAHSWPPEYAGEIAKRFGLYKTIGWPEDTWSLPSGVGDETLFLEDMYFTLEQDEKILEGLLGDRKDDLYIQIFYFTDRIGHLFWRFLDEGHPQYDPVKAAKYAPEVLKAYERMDEIVGKARKLAGPDALFLVCSDHGFSSFRRGLNTNRWLIENGFMALKGQGSGPATLEKLFDTRELFQDVDWSRTKAYALGLGSIYINLAGREKQGIVLPGAEYDEVRRKIKEGLEALVDPVTGDKPVARVFTREEMYTGYDSNLIPDLRAANSLNYRVSWQTTLGAAPKDLIENNASPWSGDHCSNHPDDVHGILFSNRKLNRDNPAMIDIAPTVLQALGVAIPQAMDGKPLH
jgi:predicted AlkP superfamily phosphohydrolase/phosphomutase